jgi:hypothetical protein
MNDFLPAILSVAALAAAFLAAWLYDRRRAERLNVPQRIQARVDTLIQMRADHKAQLR